MKNIKFLSEIFPFSVVKFAIYFNRHTHVRISIYTIDIIIIMLSLGNIFKSCIVTFAFCSEIGISNQSTIAKLNEVVNICNQLR